MRVQLHRNAVGILKHDRYEGSHPLRREQSTGVFEATAIHFKRRSLASALGEVCVGVFRRHGIDNIRHRIDADVARNFNLPCPAFKLVPFFGDARLANAVCGHPFHEKAVHRPRREIESTETAGIEAQRRARDTLADESYARPGIFFELTDALF